MSTNIETDDSPRTNDLAQDQGPATLLIVLCIFTIIGSMFTIGRGVLYEFVATLAEHDYVRGWIYAVTGIGTLVGAIMMLSRKLDGLYVYTVAQVIYIIAVAVAALSYEQFDEEVVTALSSFVAALFIIPSIIFLILYWIDPVRKYLK